MAWLMLLAVMRSWETPDGDETSEALLALGAA